MVTCWVVGGSRYEAVGQGRARARARARARSRLRARARARVRARARARVRARGKNGVRAGGLQPSGASRLNGMSSQLWLSLGENCVPKCNKLHSQIIRKL